MHNISVEDAVFHEWGQFMAVISFCCEIASIRDDLWNYLCVMDKCFPIFWLSSCLLRPESRVQVREKVEAWISFNASLLANKVYKAAKEGREHIVFAYRVHHLTLFLQTQWELMHYWFDIFYRTKE